ncbi:MAG TPA: ABC transporter substrate-binding protein [Chloroflexota bacterium]
MVFTRRALVGGLLASGLAAIGLGACARRAPTLDQPPTLASAPTAASAGSPTLSPLGAAPTGQPVSGPARRGGMLTVGVQNDWVTLDTAYNNADSSPLFMVYDPLFFQQTDASGSLQLAPGLAEKWDFSDSAATLELRRGVTFHDGSEWNAESLKWNIERIVGDQKSPARASLVGVDFTNPVSVVDTYTARINLTRAAPALMQQLSSAGFFGNLWPISRAAFDKLGPDQFARNPVGTGPFRFGEWRPSDRIILTRNDNYWMAGADGKSLPYLDGVTYRLIIDDTVRGVEVKSHNVDLVDLLNVRDTAALKSDTSLRVIESGHIANDYRMYFNARGGPFAENVQLRQAALYAIDRDSMANTLASGASDADRYILLPGAMGYDESLPSYTFDLDRARNLMQSAGYGSGVDVTLTIINREIDNQEAAMLKEMWDKISIRTTIDAMERVALNQRILTGGADYHVTTGRVTNNASSDPDLQMRQYLHSKGNFNKARSNVPEIDAALDKAGSTYDRAARTDGYREVQRLDFNNPFMGYLWRQRWNWDLTQRVQGFAEPLAGPWDFRSTWLSA